MTGYLWTFGLYVRDWAWILFVPAFFGRPWAVSLGGESAGPLQSSPP